MARHERFPTGKDTSFTARLETLVRMLVSHIFTKFKEKHVEAKAANEALSHFIKVSNRYCNIYM